MTTLHLGVIDQPYRTAGKRGAVTTGDVAEFLEARYHIMELFFDMNRDVVERMMADSYAHATATMITMQQHGGTGPPSIDPQAEAMGDIKVKFNEFLDKEALAGIVPGVPTKAALAGVSHRFKRPYARRGRGGRSRGRRPSFIDTGLYESSFIAWLDP